MHFLCGTWVVSIWVGLDWAIDVFVEAVVGDFWILNGLQQMTVVLSCNLECWTFIRVAVVKVFVVHSGLSWIVEVRTGCVAGDEAKRTWIMTARLAVCAFWKGACLLRASFRIRCGPAKWIDLWLFWIMCCLIDHLRQIERRWFVSEARGSLSSVAIPDLA